ncbi:MAG: VPLPA-CTERM sorting domain-containing protein [Proteobacteria bacterium]|nr:VPLPA-CTERM sorting domain-containing protein [Pseudomonadota bacterium]
MSIITFGQAAVLGLAIVLSATPATAVTVNEGSFAGGDFSSSYGSPTAIASGVGTVTGNLGSNDRDFLSFTGMQTGAQSVTLNLTAIGAGPVWTGSLLYSTTPFTSNSSGQFGGGIVMLNFAPFFVSMTQTLSFNLGATFGGTLFLAINQQTGTGVSYSLDIPGNVAPVPLPATALLLGGAIAGLGASRRRGKHAAA